MADVQAVLDRMEVLDQELSLQSGEADVSRGLTAVNMAQDHFEAIVAKYPTLLGDKSGTVTTSGSTETTTFPARVLRLDSLWMIDASDSLPDYKLQPLYGAGTHRDPYNDTIYNLIEPGGTTGKPRAYWTDGTNIYWDPIPDGTHTIRWYGFQSVTDYDSPADTFAYPDIVMNGIAAFGVKLFQYGFGDAPGEYTRLANEVFGPTIEALQGFRREGARPIRTAGIYI